MDLVVIFILMRSTMRQRQFILTLGWYDLEPFMSDNFDDKLVRETKDGDNAATT